MFKALLWLRKYCQKFVHFWQAPTSITVNLITLKRVWKISIELMLKWTFDFEGLSLLRGGGGSVRLEWWCRDPLASNSSDFSSSSSLDCEPLPICGSFSATFQSQWYFQVLTLNKVQTIDQNWWFEPSLEIKQLDDARDSERYGGRPL